VRFLARHRYVLVVALVLASIGVSGLVVRLTREPPAGRPLMVSPALTPEPPASADPPPPIAAAAAPRSSLPKSPVASKSASPSPSHSPSPSASKKPTKKPKAKPATPPAASSISARYNVRRGRDNDLQGFGAVSNTGKAAGSWTMTLTFQSGVRITRSYGASMSSSGSTVTFRGSLAPDKSAMFGFGGEVGRNASIRPVSCSINGHSC
jgi:cellulose binding protein with CBM2 domain